MSGFRNHSRSSQVWRYRCVGNRAVRLEVRELWAEAADVWWLAAHIAPRTDLQQFAWQRAEYCQRRSRGKTGHPPRSSGGSGCPAKIKEHTHRADAFALLSCPTPETGKSKFSPLPAFRYYL